MSPATGRREVAQPPRDLAGWCGLAWCFPTNVGHFSSEQEKKLGKKEHGASLSRREPVGLPLPARLCSQAALTAGEGL